jgi:hypothetical protein
MSQAPKARQNGVLVQPAGDELLLYDEQSHRAHCLDARAARVWALCDGQRTVPEIAREFGQGADGEVVVAWTLDALAQAELLERGPSVREALSRRRMLRNIGLAAIPVVLAITAPHARAAVSTCSAVGEPCTVKPCCPGFTCTPSLVCQ